VARHVFARPAQRDLLEIWEFIARDDVDAADRVLREIEDAVEHLADMPRSGRLRNDLTDEPLRSWPVYSYLIFYRPETSPLEVVRVVSGYRDLPELF